MEASVWWRGLSQPLPVSALFDDPSGKGIDFRFGGNKALIPVWRSGCILCLQSCPGGKVSITPALCATLLKQHDKDKPESNGAAARFFRWFNHGFDRLSVGYQKWVANC